MALLTPMTLTEAQHLGALFGLTIVGLHPILLGSVNSNFAADLEDGGRVFLRVCEESDEAAVRLGNRLLHHLVAGGVPTPAPLALSDGSDTLAEHQGKPVAIFPFIAGESCCQRSCTPAHLRAVGAALGRIHQVGRSFESPPANRFGSAQLQQRLAHLHTLSLPAPLRVDCQHLNERLTTLAARPQTNDPIIIHGDVFRDNILWQDDTLAAVLDFESASLGHPAFDLMVTLLAWCYGDHLDRDLARALIDGYRSQAPFNEEMRAHCYDEARAAAVRFAITRITDYQLRPRGVVAYKDYRRFMARLDALEEIGAAEFVDWLG